MYITSAFVAAGARPFDVCRKTIRRDGELLVTLAVRSSAFSKGALILWRLIIYAARCPRISPLHARQSNFHVQRKMGRFVPCLVPLASLHVPEKHFSIRSVLQLTLCSSVKLLQWCCALPQVKFFVVSKTIDEERSNTFKAVNESHALDELRRTSHNG